MDYKDLENYVRKDIPLEFNEINILKKHWSRVINLFEGNVLPPYEILIHPSSICNLNCKWCIGGYVSCKKNKSELLDNNLFELDNMKKIIEDLISYKKLGKNYISGKEELFKIENISFSGITGEPFMAKESLLYAIERLSKENIRVGIFTNGTLIKEDMFPTLSKLGYILCSIDAGDKNTYSQMKCNGMNTDMYDILIDNISKFIKYLKIVNSKTDVNIGYIINQYNYKEIFILAKKLKNIGVHYLRFKTDIASLLNLNEEERNVAKLEIKKIREELESDDFKIVEIHNVLDDKSKKRLHHKCFVHSLIGNISADGNVYPCNYHPKKNGYVYGSALNDNFSNIWNNLKTNAIDKMLPEICPNVCDPFKNRSNYMLEKAYEIYKDKGYDYLKKCVDNIDI